MKLVQKIVVALAAVGLVATLVVVEPRPANAAPANCPANNLCLYWDWGGGLPIYPIPAGQARNFLGTFNDQMSSWINRTGLNYCWYFDADFNGDRRVMLPHGPNRIVNVTPDEDNKASSVKICD